jgi:diguanylate cyclase (GGDEF)-like protein
VGIPELAVDAAITLFIVSELRPVRDSIMWALLVVPVLEGALRHRLRGAVLTWAAVAALYMARELVPVSGPGGSVMQAAFLAQLQDLVQRVGVVLLVAVPGAYLSEQLVSAIAGQRRAKLAATTRGQLLERVVDAGRRINQLGGEVVTELTRAAGELGFDAVDVCRYDEREGWTVAAAAGDLALPDPGAVEGAADAAWNDGASVVLSRRDVCVVATPIRGVDNAVAVLRGGLHTSASRAQVECLELLAGQAGVALRNGTLLGQLQDAHQRLEHQAYHDALSGLPNRDYFSQRLTASLRDSQPGKRVAVMFLDLDRFKAVNDTLGHEVGDDLLVAVAGRLGRAVRSGTLVARIGGDEFTVLMPDVTDGAPAERLAERICESLSAPFRLGRNEVAISTSVGIALSEGTTIGAGELMRRADVAMYKAKSRGPANYQFWSAELDGATIERMQMETELRRAVERDELALVFQPIGSVARGRIIGVEALVRWRHPERGLVGPDDFIPLAEDSGLINEVGHWVLEQACAQGKRWTEQFPGRRLSVSVNVSPRQLARPGFVAELEGVLETTGFNPRRLTLEMTERVLAGEESRDQLKAVRALGVKLAIDDFGQGQASMSYLKRFKVDILKIDKSFLHGASDNRNLAILKSMITLARDLGIQVVAEGVESADQVEQLRELECDSMQGYWFHMPMAEAEVTKLLVTRGRPHPAGRKKTEAVTA